MRREPCAPLGPLGDVGMAPHLDRALLRSNLDEIAAGAIADDSALDRPALARVSLEIGGEAMRYQARGVEGHDHAALPSPRQLCQSGRGTIDRGPAAVDEQCAPA